MLRVAALQVLFECFNVVVFHVLVHILQYNYIVSDEIVHEVRTKYKKNKVQ